MKHPSRLTVYGIDEPFHWSFIIWLFGVGIGLATIIGGIAAIAHWLSQ